MGSRLQSLIDSIVRCNFCFGEYTETQAAFSSSLVKLTVRDNHLPQDGKVLFGWRAEEEHSRHGKISEPRAQRWNTQSVLRTVHRPSLRNMTFEKWKRLKETRPSPISGLGGPRARYIHYLSVE